MDTERRRGQCAKAMVALLKAWSLSTTALGLAAVETFLALFRHIGPSLDGIAERWSKLVSVLRQANHGWREAREL